MIPVSIACLTHIHCLTQACNGLHVLKMVNLQACLVSENKLFCHECLKYHGMQLLIFKIWDDDINGFKTPSQLLKVYSQLVYAPNIDNM